MLVEDLKSGDILFGFPIYTNAGALEIYEVDKIWNIFDIYYAIKVNTIVGNNTSIYIPNNWDLDKLLFTWYCPGCIWVYTCNENLAIEYYKRALNDEFKESLPVDKVYTLWKNDWISSSEI